MQDAIMLVFKAPNGDYDLTFEDNGKVAYAYLKRNNAIISAVWLYNRCSTPSTSEWKNANNIPFANCQGFMSDSGRVQKIVSHEDIIVTWKYEKERPVANIYIFEDLYGVIDTDSKTGYARFAIKNSPIAHVMEIA